MRIITWNCNGKFREKYSEIAKLNADIYVIQECENPLKYPKHNYASFAINHLWIGSNENKGLGIFAKEGIDMEINNWENYCLRNFLSVCINKSFDILAVWAMKPYIQEYYIYQYINFNKYNKNTIVLGDFNSNKKWDKKHEDRNHSSVVKELKKIPLYSAYHYYNNVDMGEEETPTFFLQKNANKPYYIDYCFMDTSKLYSFKIGAFNDFIKYSDHMPLIIDFNF